MPVILPLEPSIGDYTFTTDLVGNTYNFRIRWNARASVWFMDVADVANTPLGSGVAILLGSPLGSTIAYVEPFAFGCFFARDTSGANREATFDDLGVRVVVEFWSLDDLKKSVLAT